MKNRFALTVAFILLFFEMFTFSYSKAEKEQLYAVHEIHKELLENSNAVIREDITTLEVVSIGEAKMYLKYAVTILNKRADHFAEVSVGYDKINKITSLQARTFDKSGILITNLKSRDIKDYASFDGSIYSDNREKYFDLRHAEYPYTIEYEVQMLRNGILSFPDWVPYSGFNVSSQKSSLKITAPES